MIEESKKEQIYKEIKNFIDVEKEEFQLIYEKLKRGFLKLQDMIDFLEIYKKIFKNFPLNDFLKIVKRYDEAKIETEIKFQPDFFQE